MARKQAEFISADDDIADVFEIMAPQSQSGPETSQSKAFEDLINDLNDETDSAELRIYQQTALGGKSSMNLLEVFPVDKYTMTELWTYLRENYGPGDYRVHLRNAGKLLANKLITIIPKKATEKGGPTVGSEVSSVLASVLGTIREQQQQMLTLMAQQNKAPDRMEMLNEMLIMKKMFDNPGAGGGGISAIKEALEVFNMMGVTINGESRRDDDDEGFTGVLKSFAPVVQAAVESAAQKPVYKPNPAPRRNSEGNPMFKYFVNAAISAAEKGKDPASYVDLVLDTLGDDKAAELLGDAKLAEKLVALNPNVAKYANWFDELTEHCKGALGMPSRFADLYSDDDNDITAEIIDPVAIDADSENL